LSQLPQKSLSITSSIRQHSRLATFTGALIVFLTFVVKEAYRDYLKDKIDSIANAESEFLLKMERIELILGFASVEEKIVTARLMSIPVDPQTYSAIRYSQMVKQAAHFGSFFELLENVEAKLKHNDARAKRMHDMDERLYKDAREFKAIATSKDFEDPLPRTEIPGRRYPMKESIAEYAEVDAASFDLYEEIFGEANQKRKPRRNSRL
jgi:hypothetical protein